MKHVTVDQIMDRQPCRNYPKTRVHKLWAGRQAITAADVLDLDIPPQDQLWAVLHEDFFEPVELYELACRFAEQALPTWETWAASHAPKLLADPRRAIEARRAWLIGDIDDAELNAASSASSSAADAALSAAWSAALSTTWSAADAAWSAAGAAFNAARNATWSAAWSLAWSLAWSAVDADKSAAFSASWRIQRDIMLDYVLHEQHGRKASKEGLG